jgi:hypothetical protein
MVKRLDESICATVDAPDEFMGVDDLDDTVVRPDRVRPIAGAA